MRTNWRLYFRNMSRCRDVAFDYWTVSVDVRHPFDIVHVTGRIHVKVRFWYNYYFLLYWGNDQGQGSDFFLIGLSVRLTLISILKGDIEFVIQDIQTFCPNRSNWNRKVYFGSVQRSFVAYIKRTCGQIISKLLFRPDSPIFSWENTE